MMAEETKQIIFRVQRYDPEKGDAPHFQEFTVPSKRGMTVLDGLLYIKENIDSSLTFRSSCRMSICGSCAMIINDFPHLACHTQIEELHSNRLTIKPLANLPIIKDLVPDLTPMFERHKSVKPYLINRNTKEQEEPTGEYRQSPQELEEFLQFSYCTKCGICVSACPTAASDKLFLGPQAMAQCYHYCADNRDEGEKERLPIVGVAHGVWNCHLAGACSEACPKGVDPALAIQLLKKRLISQAFGFGKKKQTTSLAPPPTETKEKIAYPEFTVKQD